MKKTNRGGRLATSFEDEKSLALPPLNASEFTSKLDDLLSKVSIQNRYAHRISQCNIKNMEELERARQELQRVAEERKLKQLKAGSQHDLLEQVMRRVNTSEQELKNVFKELVDAKRQIKSLKKEISDLEKSNLQLQRQLLTIKREKYYQISVAKQQVESSLLSNQVKAYLASSDKVNSILYQHCLSAFKHNDYSNFLQTLERRLENTIDSERKKHQHSQDRCMHKDPSGLKLRQSGIKREHRFKTEHIPHPKIQF